MPSLSAVLRSRPAAHYFAAALVLGVIVVGVLIALTGSDTDLDNLHATANLLATHPLRVYSAQSGRYLSYPYPPGFFPVALLERELSIHLSVPFDRVHRILIAVVYVATALSIYGYAAARRGAGNAAWCAGCFALAPLVVADVGVHGQLDILSAALCLAAVWCWRRFEGPTQLVLVTLLVGFAASVKPPPAVIGIAIFFAIPSLRKRLIFVAGVIGIPLLMLLPYLLNNASAVFRVLRYQGLDGLSGLSLLVQPHLASQWLEGSTVHASATVTGLRSVSTVLVVVAIAIGAFTVWQLRPSIERAAVYALLPVYALGVAETPYDLFWVLPFLCLVLSPRSLAAISAVTVIPAVLLYYPLAKGTFASSAGPWSGVAPVAVYVVTMDGLWLAASVWAVRNLLAAVKAARSSVATVA
jgi:hypothetical protein